MSQIDNTFGGSTSGLGTSGSNTLSALAEVKWTVSRTIGPS